MADFEIQIHAGEVRISALTERAQQRSHIKAGHKLVFKSPAEARPYVTVAEAEGFSFIGTELIAA